MRKILLLLSALMLLSSCTTMNKRECDNGEWQQAGYDDAKHGLTIERFTAHAKACSKHDVPPDQTLYKSGYKEGLKYYCRAENGLREGRKTNDYRGICPAEVETRFLTGYLQGLQYALYDLNAEYHHTRDRLRRARFHRIRADSNDQIARTDHQILQLRQRLTTLRQNRQSLKSTVIALENSLRQAG